MGARRAEPLISTARLPLVYIVSHPPHRSTNQPCRKPEMSTHCCRSVQAPRACLSSSPRVHRATSASAVKRAAPWHQPAAAAATTRRQGRSHRGRDGLRVRAIGFELPGAEPAKSEQSRDVFETAQHSAAGRPASAGQLSTLTYSPQWILPAAGAEKAAEELCRSAASLLLYSSALKGKPAQVRGHSGMGATGIPHPQCPMSHFLLFFTVVQTLLLLFAPSPAPAPRPSWACCSCCRRATR